MLKKNGFRIIITLRHFSAIVMQQERKWFAFNEAKNNLFPRAIKLVHADLDNYSSIVQNHSVLRPSYNYVFTSN